jgi:HD-like signal output (HDOD) protein/DNA-binding NarL/FixJ family response regulator
LRKYRDAKSLCAKFRDYNVRHILFVDDLAIFREPIAFFLGKSGFKVTCASNGREALQAIQSSSPDLILLDLVMPEMDGLSLLRNLKRNQTKSNIPVLVLTAMTDKKQIVEAGKLGAKGYLLKTRFSLDDLLARIRQTLKEPDAARRAETPKVDASPAPAERSPPPPEAASPPGADGNEELAKSLGVPVLFTRDKCLARARQALLGKALSGVVAQVIQIATSSGTDAAQLEASISHDPILSAKVLKVANSTTYATSRGPVMTVVDAIKKIGFATVRNIAATVGIIEAMPAGNGREGFDPIRSWQHSFAVAMLTERLVAAAQNGNQSAAAVGYLAGLCHDLGEILFNTCFADECRQVQEAHERTGRPLAELDKIMLGIPRAELIHLTLDGLNLPDAIRGPIEAMHDPKAAKNSLGLTLCLADIYANGMLLAESPKSPVRGFTAAECERALEKNAPPEMDRARIRGEIFALTMLLSQIGDPSLTAPLFPATKTPIWFARETGLPKMDPIEVALESLADVRTGPRFPIPEEMHDLKGLVIEGTDASTGPLSAANLAAFRKSCEVQLPTLWLIHKREKTPVTADLPQPMVMPVALHVLAGFAAEVQESTAEKRAA